MTGEAKQSVVLAALLARAVGTASVWDGRGPESMGVALGTASELAASAMGLGVLLAHGAHIYQKGCKGPTVGRVTELGCMDVAIALALFAGVHGQSLRAARRDLGATQQECLSLAKDWVASNGELVRWLQTDPRRVADGNFQVVPTRSWLSRMFGGKPKEGGFEAEPTIEQLEASLAAKTPGQQTDRSAAKQRDPKMDEIRRLVDEAMDEASAESLPD